MISETDLFSEKNKKSFKIFRETMFSEEYLEAKNVLTKRNSGRKL
jgi:hypothetical protein